jgi:hypothetical protein
MSSFSCEEAPLIICANHGTIENAKHDLRSDYILRQEVRGSQDPLDFSLQVMHFTGLAAARKLYPGATSNETPGYRVQE